MRHRIPPVVLAALALIILALSGCGSGGHRPTSTATPAPPSPSKLLRGPKSCDPTEGHGTMGACAPPPSTEVQQELQSTRKQASNGKHVPDVSEFQGAVNWTLASHSIGGAIARVADGSHNDADFARNWEELRRLHLWHAAYMFLRPGDCAGEARHAVALIKAAGGFDSGPLIADAEVPLNFGCASSFSAAAKQASGFHICVIYTAPGTWPGGPHGGCVLWVASYGPTPGCVWTCGHVAWQYTDGVFGPFPHCTPGIGCDDISTDNGITAIRIKHPPTHAEKVAALRGVEHRLRARETEQATLHELIDKHHCRPGQHAEPKTYHTVCGYWLRKGQVTIRVQKEQRSTIHRYHLEGIR